jgi:Predicted metal-dependent hydrolase with the TIM-barrel fold
MKRLMLKPVLLGLMSAAVGAAVAAQGQQPPADVVLTNGKIITVDGKFTIAQAAAIRGDRFVAVGSNADVNKIAGANDSEDRSRRQGRHSRPDRRPCASHPRCRDLDDGGAL